MLPSALASCFVEAVRFFFGSLSKTVPPPNTLTGITPLGFMVYPTYRLARAWAIVSAALLALYFRPLSLAHRHDRAGGN